MSGPTCTKVVGLIGCSRAEGHEGLHDPYIAPENIATLRARVVHALELADTMSRITREALEGFPPETLEAMGARPVIEALEKWSEAAELAALAVGYSRVDAPSAHVTKGGAA